MTAAATVPTSHKTRLSALFLTISSTLTKIPGLQDIKLNPGEKKKFTAQDLDGDFASSQPTGDFGEGTISGKLLWDPLGTVHQYCHLTYNDTDSDATAANNKTICVGKIKIGLTGVEYAVKYFFTKWEITAEMSNGFMVDWEAALVERVILNEADPS